MIPLLRDALLKTLESIKKDYGNNISLDFGCGGDMDQKKIHLMARIENEHCKKIKQGSFNLPSISLIFSMLL